MADDATPAETERAAPLDFDELKELLVDRAATLPPRLRQCAEHALREPERWAFDTAVSLAGAADVQPSTLVRFAQALGYRGFSDLQSVFRTRLTRERPAYEERLRRLRANQTPNAADLLVGFADTAKRSLDRLLRETDVDALNLAAKTLSKARIIHLLALRRAFPIAAYLHYTLGQFGVSSVLLDGVGGMVADRVGCVSAEDALLVATFSPFSPEVVDAARSASERGVKVVALTDSALSPVAGAADVIVEIQEAELGGFRSIAASMSLALSLAVAIGRLRREHDESEME